MKSTSVIRFAVEGGGRWRTTECYHNFNAFIRGGLRPEIEITRTLRAFARRKKNAGRSWRDIIVDFCHRRGFESGFWADTFTGLNLLSHNALYYQIDDLIILQAHSGHDARTGYLKPKVYRDPQDWLYRNAWAVISSEPLGSPAWLTDDAGETWQARGEYRDLTDYAGTTDSKERGRGKLFVSTIGIGHCPITGGALKLNTFTGNPKSIPCWR
jgi:hypothetical protein